VVEVVIGVETSNEVIASSFAFVRRLRKVPVSTAVGDGYIAYRMFSAFFDAALAMAAQGTPIPDIDSALEGYGFPLGPFRLADALGLDVALSLQEGHSSPLGLRIGEILSRVVAAGRLGRKTGRGFLTYRAGGQPPVIDGELGELLTGLIGRGKPMDANMILRHAISALANQGVRLVEDQIAQRPSDIDVVMMQVYGYPRHRGGPMMAADQAGLPRILRDLEKFSEDLPEVFAPSPLMQTLIKAGKPLSSLNRQA
jgi:3-hydroxyacyl-CoA dehydrogenase